MRIEAFERFKQLRADIEKYTEMEADLRSGAERMTQLVSGASVSAPKAYSRVEEYTVKMVRIQELRQRLEFELLTEQMKWLEIIASVVNDKLVRQIMRKRYIDGKSWHVICEELHCSNRQVLRLNREGLQRLCSADIISA